ncbi:cryptococcal mannosyltransferase 1-domain-containing protein [Lipomyces doorenjongii]
MQAHCRFSIFGSMGEMNFYARFCLLPVILWLWHPIITHNSLGLCAYLSLVFVYIPVAVIGLGWDLMNSYWKQQREETLPSWQIEILMTTGHDVKRGAGHYRLSLRHLNGNAQQGLLFAVGVIFVVWTFTIGVASPFPDGKIFLRDSQVLREALNKQTEKYYIAANFWNDEAILDQWGRELIRAIDILGPQNVYVSIAENDSEDRTPDMLRELSLQFTRLSITHSLKISTNVRPQPYANPWNNILERVNYMTKIRNKALEPLTDLNTRFSKVIFLNDVLFHHSDILKLIADSYTPFYRDDHSPGRLPTMVCGLDIEQATLYDRWVLRDKCGNPISGMYPYFRSASDQRVVRRSGVLEVGVCWNGMVVLQADPFLNVSLRDSQQLWLEEQLRFPEQPENCFASECMLLPLKLLNSTTTSIQNAPLAVMDTGVVLSYTTKWYFYYAQLLRWPVVMVWREVWEDIWWQVWWRAGFRNLYAWKGVVNMLGPAECNISGWPSCPGYTESGLGDRKQGQYALA